MFVLAHNFVCACIFIHNTIDQEIFTLTIQANIFVALNFCKYTVHVGQSKILLLLITIYYFNSYLIGELKQQTVSQLQSRLWASRAVD